MLILHLSHSGEAAANLPLTRSSAFWRGLQLLR